MEVRKRATATVYLKGEVIMRDVLMVEPVAERVCLIALFEPVQVVPAAIRQIDLIEYRVILESPKESERKIKPHGETVGSESV